jgi:octaprenyl-diphosphate synthase
VIYFYYHELVFNTFLLQVKQDIYNTLKYECASELARVDSLSSGLCETKIELIKLLYHNLMKSGGKRIRPILTILCSKLIGQTDEEAVIYLAAAVECIHAATLFHDDVIDESSIRRGNPTANSIYGNKASILVGDFLLGQSFQFMVSTKSLEALNTLAKTAVELTEAEVLQLSF